MFDDLQYEREMDMEGGPPPWREIWEENRGEEYEEDLVRFNVIIPQEIRREPQRLHAPWAIWLDKAEHDKTWLTNQTYLFTITRWRDISVIVNDMRPPDQLRRHTSYGIFRRGRVPDWNHHTNASGARWIFKITEEKLNQNWLKTIEYLVSEEGYPTSLQIQGATIKRHEEGASIAIWMANAQNMQAMMEIGLNMLNGLEKDTQLGFKFRRN